MEDSAERLELLISINGREEEFAQRFTDDLYTQLDVIPEDADELIELVVTLNTIPAGQRFLSLLLGVDFNVWLEETIEDMNELDEAENSFLNGE